MPEITNSETIQEIVKGARLQSADGVPRILSNQIVPVMECNPKLLRRTNIVKASTGTGTATIFTTDANRDFYVTAVYLSYSKAVADAGATARIDTTIDGATVTLIRLAGVTLTAERDSLSLSFPFPIKVDRNVIFQVALSNTFGNACAGVMGFYEEVKN